jgi:ketosteroid isomerase-like protein
MSRENVDIVRHSLEAFARADFDTAFAAHDPASEWRTAADEPDRHVYRGVAELRQFVDSIKELWEDRFDGRTVFEDYIERGDWVVVPWRAQLHGRTSGIAVDVTETYAVQVRDGKIVCVEEYRHVDEALARVERS